MIRPAMSASGPGVTAVSSAANVAEGRGQLAAGQGQSQPSHRHSHGHSDHHFRQASSHHHHHPCSAPVQFPQQHQLRSFLLSSELPVIPCQELQQRAQFLRQQKFAASPFHQRHSSQISIHQGSVPVSPSSVGCGSECEPHYETSVFLSSSSYSSLSLSSPPFIPFQAKRSSFEGNRGVVAPAAAGMRSITLCETSNCEQPCVIRKNKVLPPPTLSPLLPVTISNPASLSPTSPTGANPASPTLSSVSSSSGSSSSSGCSDKEDSEDTLLHAWPKMDQLFFPDHCCRTSACGAQQGRNNKYGRRNNNNSTNNNNNKKNAKKEFVSELPPPPNNKHLNHRHDETGTGEGGNSGGCMALSASIWGTGWHQVEPLPASFVKTLKASNMMWSGCEKEHHHHHHRHHRQHHAGGHHQQNRGRRDSGHCSGGSGGGGGRKGMKKDQASDLSSWSTVCSSRLPRSLQFID
ncbi:hypothetical protein BGZ47_002804 [Haplosporangium gracile]|nr:hypothetical protein BGZ47_002804 [Haplosporangium gracile]